jgi:hypothetical protein
VHARTVSPGRDGRSQAQGASSFVALGGRTTSVATELFSSIFRLSDCYRARSHVVSLSEAARPHIFSLVMRMTISIQSPQKFAPGRNAG